MSSRTGVALIIGATLLVASPFAFVHYVYSGYSGLAAFVAAVVVLCASVAAVAAAVARRSHSD